MSQTVEMHIIARIRSDFPTKFGIPRQSGLADVPARIVFEPEYRNADALRVLLVNLVDNAITYTPSGGHVTVRCGSVEGVAFIEVEDDGPGIPEAERDKVARHIDGHRLDRDDKDPEPA